MSAFDLIIVGAGPAGYVGAIRAAQLGLKTALVERAELGGVCLNWGCIPTKSLLHSADVLRACRAAADAGIQVQGVVPDLEKIVSSSRGAVERLTGGVRQLLRKNKVTVHAGHARLRGAGQVEVESPDGSRLRLSAPHVVLATGARPRRLVGLEQVTPARVWDYRDAVAPTALPESLLIVGAGAIGMEFASFYAAMGTRVHVCEARERVLPQEDEDISAFVHAAFVRDGIDVRLNCRVDGARDGAQGVALRLTQDGREDAITVERVLVSVGVTGNAEDIGLESVPEVRVADGFLATDALGATGVPGLYAVGDLAGAPWLAHKASHQAVACVEAIAGLPSAHAPKAEDIPACTFCHPQVASVGLTEKQARERGHPVRIGRFSFAGNGKAVATGLGEGLVKTVFDQDTGALLGAHLVGDGVSELIAAFAIAREAESTETELMRVAFPHPTLSEALHESVLAAFGRALHA
ncbi:dihydrolipoyl dehydrogenase [Variovorax boronicumulans]|uniref:dihydrolipoyl dehydrogenase n=1 Tax=Variovorax boronicumulans TaxID=436515 RepID=UPI001C56A7FB